MPPLSTGQESGPWTAGAAKWAAVAVLGIACIAGLAWSITGRVTHPRLSGAARRSDPSISAPSTIAAPAAPHESPSAPVPASLTRTINLNTATKAELEVLPGIGPALADRIIADRTARGAFKSVSDLDRVKGIGAKTIEKLRPLVRVE